MNQNPEQLARDRIDQQLTAAGWILQTKRTINLAAATGVAIPEYSTVVGPANYILFENCKPVGVIEAKREEEAVRLTTVKEKLAKYGHARLKYLGESSKPFVYESTDEVTSFTDYRDPKPRSRHEFTFHSSVILDIS